MTRNGDKQREIEALGVLLDRYGADRTRWPAPDRLRVAPLLKESSEARRLLAEAAAFDRLLDLAPTVAAERQAALVDGIVARALRTPAAAGPGVGVAAASSDRDHRPASPARAGDVTAVRSGRRAGRPMPRFGSSAAWPAAALLAASLVLGIFAGSNGLLPSATFGLTTSAASDTEFDGRLLALGPESGLADEDTL